MIGNYALMSCQHATRMGAFAGNNAAAELLGVPTKPYHQKAYVTCLDLGEAGALFTRGWERKVEMVGDVAKKTKQEINTVWIYPPKAERAAALASADPERVTEPLDASSDDGRARRWLRGPLNRDQPAAFTMKQETNMSLTEHEPRQHLTPRQTGARRVGSVALRGAGRRH